MPEKNLATLLASMDPHLHAEEFVFSSVSEDEFGALILKPLSVFREREGVSLIVEKTAADRASLKYSGTWSLITCQVTSDLSAVGFLATMSARLAEAGISLNAISAFHHDHLFVPAERAQEALKILRELSQL
jgi:hypothetical protein